MRTNAERLRAGLLVGAALVLAAVAGFLLVARWKAHRFLHDLPGRLGAEIEKETNGYTYSQSLGGRTVFTIHAAKATQRKDGQMLLHDVGVVLYGKTGRTNRIHGKEFTYDQKTGVVRAMGQVELDLEAPAPETAKERTAYATGGPVRDDASGQAVHVVTSGLVYVQKLGVASTPDAVRFVFRGMTGEAVGAEFNADSGTTVLERDVHMTATEEGRPATLTAQHAEFDRPTHLVQLQGARYSTSVLRGGEAAERTVEAATMRVRMSEEGAVEEVVGSGGVMVKDADSEIRSPEGTLRYSEEGRPREAVMRGGVSLVRARAEETLRGAATEARVAFVAGVASTVKLSGQARLDQHTMRGADESLAATAMLIRLKGGRMEQLDATGDAVATSVGGGAPRQEVRADHLVARFGPGKGRATVLQEVSGTGATEVHRVVGGVEETSRGDTLEAQFQPGPAKRETGAAAQGDVGGVVLASAVQRGNVRLVRVDNGTSKGQRGGGAAAAKADRMTASAAELAFDGVTGKEVLRGGVQVEDGESALRADVVEGNRASGDAVATGNVLATYVQAVTGAGAREQEPMHVRSSRANFHRETETAEFFGGAGGGEPARVWQGGSQVEAPVVMVDRKRQQMDAKGGAGEVLPVHVVLVNESGAATRGPRAGAAGGKAGLPEASGVTRIRSGTLHYDGAVRKAFFAGGVVMQDGGSELHSQTATALLRPAGTGEARGAGFAAGGLESVTAVGDVVIDQPPARVAHGAKAVYTAEDGMVVLTGAPGAPPRAEDQVNGSVSGASLRFRAGDNSVMVEGRSRADETASGDGRVHTKTRVRPPQ